MGKPSAPKFARNKNILVIGGSGSGKTRFFVKPNLMQMHSSYVVTDPKGTVLVECGSLHIKDNDPGERGAWFRFSEDKGGDNIGFLREYMGMSFVDAVEALTGEHIDRTYSAMLPKAHSMLIPIRLWRTSRNSSLRS